MNIFSEDELKEIEKVAKEGFFDAVDGICKVEKETVKLSNPFKNEEDFKSFKSVNGDLLPKWIREATSLVEFYSVTLELQGLLNYLKEKQTTKAFLEEYNKVKTGSHV